MVEPQHAVPYTHESNDSEANLSSNSHHDEVSINKIGSTKHHNLLVKSDDEKEVEEAVDNLQKPESKTFVVPKLD